VEENTGVLSGNVFHDEPDVALRAPTDHDIAVSELDDPLSLQRTENLQIGSFFDRNSFSESGANHLHRGGKAILFFSQFHPPLALLKKSLLGHTERFAEALNLGPISRSSS
jgi:hypothetical protein